MDILRVTARWAGFPGAPGYSAFHFRRDGGFWDGGILGPGAEAAAQDAADTVLSGLNFVRGVLPSGVSIEVQSEAEILDSDTGELVGFAEIDGGSSGAGSGTGGFSGASGAVVNWRTNDYRFGRRVRGRTFLVPLSGDTYDPDGTLTTDALGTIRSFGNALLSGSGDAEFGVWSRPRGGTGGVFATATSFNVPDMAAVLRSRRD